MDMWEGITPVRHVGEILYYQLAMWKASLLPAAFPIPITSPMAPFHHLKTQDASTSKRRWGQSLPDPALEVERRWHQAVRLSAAVRARR